ncbi:MAG: hypothetical protein K9L65_02020 [Chromatiaceae bacterium]|nr:hypothetical protein [Chromatiaceae bacterium]
MRTHLLFAVLLGLTLTLNGQAQEDVESKPYQLDRSQCVGLGAAEIEAELNMTLETILPANRPGNCHFNSPSSLSLDIKHWPRGMGKRRFRMAKETAEQWGGVQTLDFGEESFRTQNGVQVYVLMENGDVVEVSTQPENLKSEDSLVTLVEQYLAAQYPEEP